MDLEQTKTGLAKWETVTTAVKDTSSWSIGSTVETAASGSRRRQHAGARGSADGNRSNPDDSGVLLSEDGGKVRCRNGAGSFVMLHGVLSFLAAIPTIGFASQLHSE